MSTLAERLQQIVDNVSLSKADRARALFDLGCDRSDVVELLGMSYSQAHSIWKKRQTGEAERSHPDVGSVTRTDHRRGKTRDVFRPEFVDGPGDRPTFFFSPNQTRYITQDGHVIVRVDTNGGPECRQCGQPLDFALKYLGFVHKFSQSEPTNIEDHYQ